MTPQPGRLYLLTPADFPISIEIEAIELPANQAFVANTQISVGGTPVGEQPVKVKETGLIKSYSISKPAQKKCDLLSVINGWFADQATDKSKYVVKIVAASGDAAQTKMFRPAVNPSAAFLVFRLG
jgi:hypothetical protein